MTKKDLQKELLEKVKPGAKPSDIKRLKRSKSADDITQIPTPPNHLLTDQLQEKQKQIEDLRKVLETVNQELAETKQSLDNSLEARLNSLKDWTKQREQIKSLSKELDDTVEQAATELQQGDTEISQLRTKVWTLKSAKEQLERELKLARINRRSSTNNSPNSNDYETEFDYLQYALYSLFAVGFVLTLINSKNISEND